jgi:secreted trypsin-like serine protease
LRVRLFLALMATTVTLRLPGSANAIVGGTPDLAHPYVGLEDNGVFACTGTLLSPRVLVTAAHCFSNSESAYGTMNGQPVVKVTFDQQGFFASNPQSHFGTYYWDPLFCLGCAGGTPGFDTHDVAVIVLNDSVSMPVYGELPPLNLDTTLPTGTNLDIVGYGVQHFGKPDPCVPNCKKQPDAAFTRFAATSRLVSVGAGKDGEFVKISGTTSQGKGAQCFGDSGGPLFLHATNLLIAETSFGTNANCSGVGYDLRLDTRKAQDFIFNTLGDLGLTL